MKWIGRALVLVALFLLIYMGITFALDLAVTFVIPGFRIRVTASDLEQIYWIRIWGSFIVTVILLVVFSKRRWGSASKTSEPSPTTE